MTGQGVPDTEAEVPMRYMMLIHHDEAALAKAPPSLWGDWAAFNEAAAKADIAYQPGSRLGPSSTASTVRVAGDKTSVLDGPYADTKEQLAGYFTVDVPDPGQAATTAYNLNPNLDLVALITHSTALKAARASAGQANLDLLWAEWSAAQQARQLAVTIMAAEAKARVLRAIAEGIEDTEQLRALRSLGCQYGQGFLFSRPLSAPDTRALLESWSPAEAVALVGGVA